MKLQSRSYYVRRQEDSRTWLQNEELHALQKRVNSADSTRTRDESVEMNGLGGVYRCLLLKPGAG